MQVPSLYIHLTRRPHYLPAHSKLHAFQTFGTEVLPQRPGRKDPPQQYLYFFISVIEMVDLRSVVNESYLQQAYINYIVPKPWSMQILPIGTSNRLWTMSVPFMVFKRNKNYRQ